jgi:hypothetical protein
MGRITCEQKGECFFLTFLKEDVEDEKDGLRQGDEVSFFVSTHKRYLETVMISNADFSVHKL